MEKKDTDCSCKPVLNGYFCNNLTNSDLQRIQTNHQLNFQVDTTANSNKLHFQDTNGKDKATAIRIKDSEIRMYSSENYCSK